MLRSDVHRFYLCEDDLELVESNVIETANTELALLDAEFMLMERLTLCSLSKKLLDINGMILIISN